MRWILILFMTLFFSSCSLDKLEKEEVYEFEKKYMGVDISLNDRNKRIQEFFSRYKNLRQHCIEHEKSLIKISELRNLVHAEIAMFCFNRAIVRNDKNLLEYAQRYLKLGLDLLDQDFFGVCPIVNAVSMGRFDVYEYILVNDRKRLEGDKERLEFYRLLDMYVKI